MNRCCWCGRFARAGELWTWISVASTVGGCQRFMLHRQGFGCAR